VPEQRARAVQADAHAFLTDSQRAGGVGRAHFIDLAQGKDGAVRFGQLAERVAERQPRFAVQRQLFGITAARDQGKLRRRVAVKQGLQLPVAAAPAQNTQGFVDHDACHPG